MCYNQAPWVDDLDPNLAYGFVYAKQSYAGCNRCFEFDFAQSVGKYEEEWGGYSDVGSMRLSRKRKRMIVQAVAVDASFDDGQFGIFVPGGGVESQWRGCMVQWGLQQRPTLDIGASYGGMLARCQGCADPGRGCVPDRRLNYDELKLCVKAMCNATFGALDIVCFVPLGNKAITGTKVGTHRGERDTVFESQTSNLSRLFNKHRRISFLFAHRRQASIRKLIKKENQNSCTNFL